MELKVSTRFFSKYHQRLLPNINLFRPFPHSGTQASMLSGCSEASLLWAGVDPIADGTAQNLRYGINILGRLELIRPDLMIALVTFEL